MHSLESLKSAIRRSLARSAQYGVDPHSDGAPEATKLTDRELEDRIQAQFEYYSLAREQLDTLYRLLRGTGFCMALADRDGYVVYVTGDPDLVEHFKRRRCIPGYRWTERDIGTCAIGLALEERKITQVSINMTDYTATPLHRVFETVKSEAARYGVNVVGSEIIGLTPMQALLDAADFYLRLEGFKREQVLEARLLGE